MKKLLLRFVPAAIGFLLLIVAAVAAPVGRDGGAKFSLHIWVSAGPLAYLSGGRVVVRNAKGVVLATGQTGQRGTLTLGVDQAAASNGPLQIAASGGMANGVRFAGHLSAEAMIKDPNASVVHVDLLSTAAELLRAHGYSYASGMAAARDALGIGIGAPVDVLRVGNIHVGPVELAAAASKPGGVDAVIRRIVAAAASHKTINELHPFDLAQRNPALLQKLTQSQRAPSVSQTAPLSSQTLTASQSAVCTSGLGDATSSSASSVNIADYGAIGIGSLLEVAGTPSPVNDAITGMLLSSVGIDNKSPELAAIENVERQLDCISQQIVYLQEQIALLTFRVDVATAAACDAEVDNSWRDYLFAVNSAETDPLNKENASLAQEWIPEWTHMGETCGAVINHMLFGTVGGAGSAWQDLAGGYQKSYNWYTALQVQQLQSFLSYWGTKTYEQFVMTNEVYNYHGTFPAAQSAAGGGSSGSTACAFGATNSPGTFCTWQQAIQSAYPGNLYTDEIGMPASGLSLSAYPAGLTLPQQQNANQSLLFNGTYLANHYYATHAPYDTEPLAAAALTDLNSKVPATNSGDSAVETYASPQVARSTTIATGQIGVLKAPGPGGISMAQYFYNAINSAGNWSGAGVGVGTSGFYTSDDRSNGSISELPNSGSTVIVKFGSFNTIPDITLYCVPQCLGGGDSVLSVLLGRTWWAGSSSPMTYATLPAPQTVPDKPSLTSVTPGAGQISVAFKAPAQSGTTPLIGYRATCSAEGAISVTAAGTTSPIAVTYLTGGRLYNCSAQAQNSGGYSLSSKALPATPTAISAAVPDPPILTAVTGGSQEVTNVFTGPAHQGSAPVTSYKASCTSTTGTFTASGSASPIAVKSLVAGDAYKCVVTAQNDAGSSIDSNALTATASGPPTIPGAPTMNAAPMLVAGSDYTIYFSFTPPANTGYLPLTSMTGTCTGGKGAYSATWPPANPLGQTYLKAPGNDTYICSVTAMNSEGSGPASNSVTAYVYQ